MFISNDDFYRYLYKNNISRNKYVYKEIIKQLDEYFNNNIKYFDLNLNIDTTDFRNKVYNELFKIHYGDTRSYSTIAKCINNEKAVVRLIDAIKSLL